MTKEQVQEVENLVPELEVLKAAKKAGEFWEIYNYALPVLKLLVLTAWFLPAKIKNVLKALILAGEAYLETQKEDEK